MRDLELKAYDREKSRLAIGIDPGNDNEPIVNILWVPYIDHHDHDHIELDRASAIKLRDWLTEYIDDTAS